MKFIIFTLCIMIAVAMVACQECSPWLGLCTQYSDCCRNLECSFYAAKCVPKSGLRVPGQDTRPLGPGPYPPY